jgi:hypothetical protein
MKNRAAAMIAGAILALAGMVGMGAAPPRSKAEPLGEGFAALGGLVFIIAAIACVVDHFNRPSPK